VINAFLATGGDWRAIVLSLVNIGIGLLIWTPFIIAANKYELNDLE
jgi:PTS system cellobiose-specific IIC component